ncbi:AraC family transcriptional regulator [Streptomyces sp. NPDC051001]|uniref:AraC family transcriptional regulator n=1 Tax=Streptomyces sp. NPDC051001 TaxID=3155795 RepID=UPI00342C1EBB
MRALLIATDGTVTELDLPESAAHSAIRDHLGSTDAVDQGLCHPRVLLHVHGNGQVTSLDGNLTAWALASVWRGMPLYPFHGPVAVTGRTQHGGPARWTTNSPRTYTCPPAVLTPHPDDTAWLQQTALQLLDEHRALGRRPLDIHHALRRSLLESLLLRLANSPDIAPTGTTPVGTGRADKYGRFLDAVELHFRELHQAADYAELLGCSVRTLSRAARDATGKGVRELIDERRLLEARRLLGVAWWDARTVAVHLGFSDPANFGRFFRDRTGLTPAAFAARTARTDA